MKTNQQLARRAGIFYLLMAVFGAFGMLYVSGNIVVEGDVAASLRNITTNENLYRLGIVSNVLCQVAFIFLAIDLYRLFKSTNQWMSTVLFSLVLAAVPIAILNEINRVAVLYSLSAGDELNEMAQLFYHLHEKGIALVEIFWGLWLLPLAVLIIQSNYLPKIIGYLLIAGCLSYLMEWFIQILYPAGFSWMTQVLTYASLGEFATMFYLTIVGVRKSKREGLSVNSL